MPRTGAYIMRSGSFEATITASEGNITFGHSGSVKFIDAASGSVAELTSSTSGSTMQTEFILGERVADKPFWVFKPDGRMQYSRGGTTKVTEVDMNEKFLVASRSSHDAAGKFEHMEVTERAHGDKKTTIDASENTFAKGIVVSGSTPFLSLYDTDDASITKFDSSKYMYVSQASAWTVGQRTTAGGDNYWGGQGDISFDTPPNTFYWSSSGDYWTKGDISGSSVTVTGTVTAEQITSTDDMNVTDDLDVGGKFTVGGKVEMTDGNYIQWGGGSGATFLREHGDILYVAGEDKINLNGAVYQSVITFTNGDTEPDVSGGNVFKTANLGATTIEGLTGGTAGQEVTIILGDSNTDFQDGTNFNLFRSMDWTTAATNDVLKMICVDGTKWVSTGRLDNS